MLLVTHQSRHQAQVSTQEENCPFSLQPRSNQLENFPALLGMGPWHTAASRWEPRATCTGAFCTVPLALSVQKQRHLGACASSPLRGTALVE